MALVHALMTGRGIVMLGAIGIEVGDGQTRGGELSMLSGGGLGIVESPRSLCKSELKANLA
jgi:hypothetical protein